MDYHQAEKEYPCVNRTGMGYAGCACNGAQPDPRYISCTAYGTNTLRATECITCPYRMALDKQRQVLKG